MARLVLGVGGGIAAYKSVALARLLVEAGHSVKVVPTPAGLKFVGRATWEAITGHSAKAEVLAGSKGVDHVAIGQRADLVVIAPATADLLARVAAGMADDLLTATLLATTAPVLMAPAMHTAMYVHPATQANLNTLRSRGVHFIGPDSGRLTGSDSGPGRMSEPAAIAAAVVELLGRRNDLAGIRLVVSAGGTREAIDPVRYIGNSSSGKQGFALAEAAASRGAMVTVVAANVALATPPGVRRLDVTSAAELGEAMNDCAAEADVIIMAAAVADFRPLAAESEKIKRSGASGLQLDLVPNPDILARLVTNRPGGQIVVGFAAETGDRTLSALEHGRRKAIAKAADLTVVNVVGNGRGFSTDTNSIWILDATGAEVGTGSGTKAQVANAILDAVAVRVSASR